MSKLTALNWSQRVTMRMISDSQIVFPLPLVYTGPVSRRL